MEQSHQEGKATRGTAAGGSSSKSSHARTTQCNCEKSRRGALGEELRILRKAGQFWLLSRAQLDTRDQPNYQALRCCWEISAVDHDSEFHVPLQRGTGEFALVNSRICQSITDLS